MLVLSRKLKQSFCIGNDIKVHVLQMKGGSVRIGIEAPKHKRVIRTELIEQAIEYADAAATSPEMLTTIIESDGKE